VMLRRLDAALWDWKRTPDESPVAWDVTREIVADVRRDGDAAVRSYTAQHDGIEAAGATEGIGETGTGLWALQVPPHMLQDAWESLDGSLKAALEAAAARIRKFHEATRPGDVEICPSAGERLGLTRRALRRVGVYAPGGKAAYPSTVLMNVIPAQVAGVPQIALASPPQRDTGWPHPLVLAAAHFLGVAEVYRMGGAQAIAALAYGTQEVARVDKVVGPGNLYVALAKRAVMGDVGIDSIAGPSEVFIVADASANPAYIAADMLAQAEHDAEAGAVCVLVGGVVAGAGAASGSPAAAAVGMMAALRPFADAIEAALAEQLSTLPRREIAAAAIAKWGAIVFATGKTEACEIINHSAPEHVELLVADANSWLPQLHTVGAVFIGSHTPEPVGDYYAGTNHVLPTHGSARYASGLGVEDFMRRMSYVEYSAETLAAHAGHIVALAEAEGLAAHGRAVTIRTHAGRGTS